MRLAPRRNNICNPFFVLLRLATYSLGLIVAAGFLLSFIGSSVIPYTLSPAVVTRGYVRRSKADAAPTSHSRRSISAVLTCIPSPLPSQQQQQQQEEFNSPGVIPYEVLPSRLVMSPELRPLEPWRIFLHGGAVDILSAGVLDAGVWEPQIMARISAILGGPVSASVAAKLFLDIGANVGFHTLAVLALGHNTVAIEPFGYNFNLLKMAIRANPGFSARSREFKVALTDNVSSAADACIVSTSHANRGNARLIPLSMPPTQVELDSHTCEGMWIRCADDGERWIEHGRFDPALGPSQMPMTGERVSLARLDSLLHPVCDPIHVIKADVEGFETLALRGASALLDAHAPCAVLFERNAFAMRFSGVDPSALLRDFVARGYRLFRVGDIDDITPTDLSEDAPPGSQPALHNGEYEMRLMTGEARCASAMLTHAMFPTEGT